ncbi:hypothetical protein D3C72_1488990 [compost metagenome]
MQPKVIARIANRSQGEVGVGTAGVGAGIQALRPIQYRDLHRCVLEHEQAVEQWLALGQLTALLNAHQWQVLVLTQLHVAFKQVF